MGRRPQHHAEFGRFVKSLRNVDGRKWKESDAARYAGKIDKRMTRNTIVRLERGEFVNLKPWALTALSRLYHLPEDLFTSKLNPEHTIIRPTATAQLPATSDRVTTPSTTSPTANGRKHGAVDPETRLESHREGLRDAIQKAKTTNRRASADIAHLEDLLTKIFGDQFRSASGETSNRSGRHRKTRG
jgi:hypothetical protein